MITERSYAISTTTNTARTSDYAALPAELLSAIFAHLDPFTLALCQRVCSNWCNVARDDHLYYAFAEKLKFFYIEQGRNVFKNCAFHYFKVYIKKIKKAHPGEIGLYKHLKNYQDPGVRMVMRREWSDYVKDNQCYDSLVSGHENYFLPMPLQASLVSWDAIEAYLYLGAQEFETRFNRPFLLACYFGRGDLLAPILEIEGATLMYNDPNQMFLQGAVLAVKTGQLHMLTVLHGLGADFNKPYRGADNFYDYVLENNYFRAATLLHNLGMRGKNFCIPMDRPHKTLRSQQSRH